MEEVGVRLFGRMLPTRWHSVPEVSRCQDGFYNSFWILGSGAVPSLGRNFCNEEEKGAYFITEVSILRIVCGHVFDMFG